MTMAASPTLIDELYRVEGKAEIIRGEIVHFMATGRMPSVAGLRIAASLDSHVEAEGLPGGVVPDNAGFIVDLPNRESFFPDIPAVYRRGEMAQAEPAVPGWTMPVDNLFQKKRTPQGALPINL